MVADNFVFSQAMFITRWNLNLTEWNNSNLLDLFLLFPQLSMMLMAFFDHPSV
jgi:hypothetical protein